MMATPHTIATCQSPLCAPVSTDACTPRHNRGRSEDKCPRIRRRIACREMHLLDSPRFPPAVSADGKMGMSPGQSYPLDALPARHFPAGTEFAVFVQTPGTQDQAPARSPISIPCTRQNTLRHAIAVDFAARFVIRLECVQAPISSDRRGDDVSKVETNVDRRLWRRLRVLGSNARHTISRRPSRIAPVQSLSAAASGVSHVGRPVLRQAL